MEKNHSNIYIVINKELFEEHWNYPVINRETEEYDYEGVHLDEGEETYIPQYEQLDEFTLRFSLIDFSWFWDCNTFHREELRTLNASKAMLRKHIRKFNPLSSVAFNHEAQETIEVGRRNKRLIRWLYKLQKSWLILDKQGRELGYFQGHHTGSYGAILLRPTVPNYLGRANLVSISDITIPEAFLADE